MGQGLTGGAMAGAALSITALPLRLTLADHLGICGAATACGLALDFASDCCSKEGRVIIHRDVLLKAQDPLRHLSTFYTTCESNRMARLFRQKHEWVVLESHGQQYYVVQKNPATGDVLMDVRNSLRAANDVGLQVAGKPMHTGEIRQHRMETEFDLPSDLQVAYVIAWLRKEDPRWAFSTENSRQFTARVRYALMDF
ncbi:uncharacterized protein TEOVI_000687800 [Trypanosoma equiperdum]|uniref:Uncharacterized protein n=4 Tax=Trypanozoon TaxID=39700 RepID=Q38AI8_TRYB2|nr:hypothetical protein, conserved [Trypanosoma brucei gambiense DAL972]XP_823010.1 hypothetical protein, conserved [Trypanosoma brucei brucei TREU927]RHW68567.1 hypothetical protein DPX39_100084700 [Trypanosoma brucei equiperdum]SCU65510.1 hypothetical protein, conserved [Trypanosoma equiperdum]EAN78182.1 hypothetical protein, conserved [Trypanosoma brucei brucei TREU927]CBH15860.1 hypothetical protein, conserved [Trypanosoma brucei gambiense DAL972]|eukprot:XP_011778124.1 hypothetical protein, conserved [Trypanosoma brucei gambiense DAL972]